VSVLAAIETATDTGSVALGTADEIFGEVLIGSRTRHAESLLPALDYLLRSAGMPRSGLSGIVVGAGPGSFTGVRVAAATARGLALGLGVPLYAGSSLAALACGAGMSGAVCAMFDARRGEVYAACYDIEAEGIRRTLLAPMVAAVGEVAAAMADHRPVFVGEGAVRYADALGIEAPPPLAPRAATLLTLVARSRGGLVAVPADWEPEYLRSSGAERGVRG
jgi:tRNA threonylcarbamoyladenosine biosynthesis protein TsaB